MKNTITPCLFIALFTILSTGCTDNKKTNEATTESKQQTDGKTDKPASADNSINLQAPDFADPALTQHYKNYTEYIKKLVTAIRNKDEAGTMKLFTEEGKQFDNRNEIDQKAQSAEKEKFTTWLLQSAPYQREIVESPYYKKFMEEHYKKVKEDFKKKGY